MEEDNQNNCVFKDILETCNTSKCYDSKSLSDTQQSTIIRCSVERQDNFIASFEEDDKYEYHKDCYTAYTSKDKIARYLKNENWTETNRLMSPHLHRNG